ncbi:MAG: hypothetical protein DWQ02_26805 [Bacteroidetes bacterium]|nr:MAG: hypothetical protein DWQ02_26805 [Bacteroidota bacterium]
MKRKPITLSIIFIGLFIFACQGPQNDPDSTTPETEEIPEGMAEAETTAAASVTDTISVDTFNTWKQNWDRNGRGWMDTSSLKAFNFPVVDLEEVLGEQPDSTRFYIGLESNGSGGYTPKLMMVGVKAGKDMIDYSKSQYIYDVSSPCPPLCGN